MLVSSWLPRVTKLLKLASYVFFYFGKCKWGIDEPGLGKIFKLASNKAIYRKGDSMQNAAVIKNNHDCSMS